MNFHEILSGPLGQRLAWTLLHFLWQGLLMGAGAAAAGWLLLPSQTRGRYAVAMTGLVLMACCPLVTFAVLQVPTPNPVVLAPPPDLRVGNPQAPMTVPIPDDIGLPARSPSRLVSIPPPSAHRIVSNTPAMPVPVAPPVEPEWREWFARRAAAFQPYAVMVWLAGVVALSGRLLMSVLAVRRLARGRLPVSTELAACANRLAQRLGLSASPGVFLSMRIREAMLVGLWRPMVLLPAAWIAEMPADVLEAVIAHELAHVRRLDLWANLLQRLVETLLFYHPTVWWLSRRASLLREMCADELAVEATGERMTYATVLELLGRRRLNRPAPQLATGIGGRRMALFARVRNVLGAVPGDERLRWWPAGLLALLVPLGMWLGTLGLCGDLTAKKTTIAEKPKADGDAGKSSAVAPDETSDRTTPLDTILKRLAEEERRYNPIEITATSTYQHLNKEDSGMEGLVLKMETRERSVVAGERLFHEKTEESQSNGGAKTSILARQAYDGLWTRNDTELIKSQSKEHTSASIILGRADEYLRPLRAHMLPFHDDFVFYTSLSSFLASGWFNEHDGYSMTVEYLGDEQAEGLSCHKLKCALPTRGKVDRYILLWLARDRNLLPVRKEWHEFDYKGTVPTGVFRVTELREIRPGLWFPFKASDVAYRKEELRNGRLLLQWQRDVQVEKVAIAPPADEMFFGTVKAPKGTLVYVADRGGKRIGKFTQPRAGNIEISLDDFHAMQRAAQANVRDEYDPQDATAPKRKERIDAAFATLRADPPLAQKERIEAAVTILQNYGISQTNRKKWATAIRELIAIGKPALPRLIDELDHIDRANRQETELRALGFVLRGIDDPRAVPALIRALPHTLQKPSSDFACSVDDPELFAFMRRHDNDHGVNESSFSFGRPINEILPALQKLTGVVAILPTEDGGREFGGIHGIFLSGDAKKVSGQRQLFLRFAERWAGWWAKNWKQFVSDEKDAQLDDTRAALDRFAKQIAAMPDGGQSPDVTPKASLTKAGDASAKTSATAAIGPLPTIDQISAAWAARQKRVRSAKVQWKATEFIEKDSLPIPPGLFDSSETSADKKVEWQPPKDVSVDCTQTVFVNGSMMRMDRDGPYWNLPRRDLEQDARVCTSDGEVAKTFCDERTIHELYGFIEPEARNPEYNCYLYRPIAFAFRPCDSDMGGLDLKSCTIHHGLESVDGRTCAVLSAPNMTLWLDPARDFVAVKVREEDTTRTCDISYREDELHVWVPVEWKTAQILHGKVLERIVAQVTNCKLNVDIPRSTFQFEFPVGTYVSVLKKADEGNETSESYIVRPGGTKRLITKEELRRGAAADYQELLRTESGMARGKPRRSDDKSPAANGSPGKDWSMTLNDMRVRLLAPKGTTYRRGAILPLVVELQNYGDKPIPCSTLWRTVRITARDDDYNDWHGAPGMGPELADWVGQGDLAPGKTAELRLSFQSRRFGRPLKAGETIQLQASAPTQQPRPGQLPLEVLTPPVSIRVQDAFPSDVGDSDFPDKWQMNLACELFLGLKGGTRWLQVDERGAAKLLNAYQVNGQRINNCLQVTLPPERLKNLAAALRQMKAWKLAQVRRDTPPNPDEGYIRLSLVCPSGASVVGQYASHAESSQPIVSELRKLLEGLIDDIENTAKTSAAAPAEGSNKKSPPPAVVKPEESSPPKNKSSAASVDPQLKIVQEATTNAWKQLVAGEGRGTCRRIIRDKPDEKFDFEFAFDGDKFRFVMIDGPQRRHIAVSDGSATLVRDYSDKLESAQRVAILRPPEFTNLLSLLKLPFIDIPRCPHGFLGEFFETRAVNVVKLPDSRLHGAFDLNQFVHSEFDATADSGYHISRVETFNKSEPRTGSIFTAKWKQNKDIWFVAAITREDWRQGAIADRSEVRYTEFKPNPRLPDDTFSIRSLQLQPGSTIIDQRPGWSKSYRVGDPDDLGKNKRTMAEDVDSLPIH